MERPPKRKINLKKLASPKKRNEEHHSISDQEKMTAWLEWRKWCSIIRVKAPCVTEDEKNAGLQDDKSPEERIKLYKYLHYRVSSFLYKITEKFCPLAENILITAFDDFMKSYIKKDNKWFKKGETTYKNYIFSIIANSDDPPLKVLNGKIFSNGSKTKGYCFDLAKKIIADNIILNGPKSSLFKKDSKYASVILMRSLDDVNKDNDTNLYDVIGNYDKTHENYDMTNLLSLFTREEKILILAVYSKMKPYDEKVLAAMKCGKTAAYDLYNTLFPKRSGAKETDMAFISRIKKAGYEHDIWNINFLIQLKKSIYSELSAEKSLESFLDETEEQIKKEGEDK